MLVRRHFFHTTHELVLREEDRQCVGRSGFAVDIVFELVVLRNKRLESFAEAFFLLVGIGVLCNCRARAATFPPSLVNFIIGKCQWDEN